MKRCSFCEWIPILPWPVWPLAGQCSLGQNAVVGSMTLLLAVRGNIATRSMSGPPFALQRHRTTVWCRAILEPGLRRSIAGVGSRGMSILCLTRGMPGPIQEAPQERHTVTPDGGEAQKASKSREGEGEER